MKIALITGITGQDGSYLAEILLKKGYIVHGIIRRSSSFNTKRIDHIYNDPKLLDKSFFLHYGDLVDTSNLNRLLDKIKPDEIYNLAAQSHVHVSFNLPDYTAQVDALGTLKFLDALKEVGLQKTRFYQASTSELYGKVQEIPQNETTPFYPRSPYAVAKLFAYWAIINYREAYNIFAANGILFNHESPRRGETFITKKITKAVSNIIFGYQKQLIVGNINSKRDWGFAPEYCEGMWRILQYEKPEDFVLATGETHSVREFIETAFSEVGIQIGWKGKAENEFGYVEDYNPGKSETLIDNLEYLTNIKIGDVLVKVSPKYYRPTEVDLLLGDYTKARNLLNWEPKTTFNELVGCMVKSDINEILNRFNKDFRDRMLLSQVLG